MHKTYRLNRIMTRQGFQWLKQVMRIKQPQVAANDD